MGKKKLGTTLELLQWKAKNGASDKSFGKLLKIMKKVLPRANELPTTISKQRRLSLDVASSRRGLALYL